MGSIRSVSCQEVEIGQKPRTERVHPGPLDAEVTYVHAIPAGSDHPLTLEALDVGEDKAAVCISKGRKEGISHLLPHPHPTPRIN